jgi:polyisoprenoid-binding protein YceI
MNRILIALALAAPLSILACKDPGKDASKAVTEEAKTAEAPKAGEVIPFDSKTSKVDFVGSKVTGSHTGNFGNFDGRVELVDGKIEASTVRVDIDMKSVSSDTEKLTGHLKSKDFFEVDRFPKATFVSTKIVPGGDKGATHTITGNLELHGVTKSITFPATIAVSKDAVTANAEFAIDRTNWGINYEGMADNLIRKDVVLKLAINAPRKPGA